MCAEAFDQDVLIVRRSSFIMAAAASPAVMGAALATNGHTPALVAGAALGWLGIGLLFHVWRRNPAPTQRRARARANARGLFIDGRLVLPSSRVRGGWLQPRSSGPPLVRVRAGVAGPSIDIAVRDMESGRAMLRALAVDPTRVLAHYWTLAPPWGEPRWLARLTASVGLLLVFGVLAGRASPVALTMVVVALIVLLVGGAAPMRVTVGADGLLLQWLGMARFVGWSSVVDIQPFERGAVLALAEGQWLTLRMPATHGGHDADREAMLERMRAARRAHGRRRPDETAARLVGRAGGGSREWVRAVRALVTTWNGYRAAGVPASRLWRIVEDPAVDRESRTGAAVALAPLLDSSGRGRLRAAAFSCAEPRLRIALATLATAVGATASDEELAATLDAIDSDWEGDMPQGT